MTTICRHRLFLLLPLLLVAARLDAQERESVDLHGLQERLPRAMGASSGDAFGILSPGRLLVKFDGGALSADHYYGVASELRRFDTNGTSYTRLFARPSVRYGLFDRFDLSLELPLTYERLTSAERFPERSIGRLASVDLGAGWGALQFFSSNDTAITSRTSIAVRGRLSIPTGFHNGLDNDPKHPSFLDDGALEGELGLAGVYVTPELEIGGRVGYRMRGEELEDEIPWSLSIDLTRIRGAAIGVGAFGAVSVADPSHPSRPFYAGSSGTAAEQTEIDGGRGIFRRPDRETYAGIHAGVTVDLGDTWSLGAHYGVRLVGTNALGMSGAWLTVGYRN